MSKKKSHVHFTFLDPVPASLGIGSTLKNSRRKHHPRLDKLGKAVLVAVIIWFGVGFVQHIVWRNTRPTMIDLPVRLAGQVVSDLWTKD
jgi:hypothetical protein